MKTATLALIVQNDKILLGHKKKGEIGTGTWNGPGGKMDPEDASVIDCVIRETDEETGGAVHLDPTQLDKLGVITFHAAGIPDFEVHIFRTETADLPEEIPETDDMVFAWHPLDNLPFSEMLDSDREWFTKAAQGEHFNANVYYRERAKDFERIEFLPS